MATPSAPDGIYFELSPRIVLTVRIINILTLLEVLITFILCLVQGESSPANYLLAGNVVISAFVGIVANWWYRSGDLGSEKFWYIILVAAVLVFQCVACDLFIFKESINIVVAPTLSPVNSSTRVYSWAPFRTTRNRSFVEPLPTLPSLSLN